MDHSSSYGHDPAVRCIALFTVARLSRPSQEGGQAAWKRFAGGCYEDALRSPFGFAIGVVAVRSTSGQHHLHEDVTRAAGVTRFGWKILLPVCCAIAAGVVVILIAELSGAAQDRHAGRDLALIAGGVLLGLASVAFYEIYVAGRRITLTERERDAERRRHQDERRLDFEQYRALQSELRQTRSQLSALQAKADLTGAIDRERVGDALILGFYFHRRNERLPSSPKHSIFTIAAQRLKLRNGKPQITLEKPALHELLHMAYGPIVAEAFDLGYVLSRLGEGGFAESHSQILADLESLRQRM
jgi:hypothetical protein